MKIGRDKERQKADKGHTRMPQRRKRHVPTWQTVQDQSSGSSETHRRCHPPCTPGSTLMSAAIALADYHKTARASWPRSPSPNSGSDSAIKPVLAPTFYHGVLVPPGTAQGDSQHIYAHSNCPSTMGPEHYPSHLQGQGRFGRAPEQSPHVSIILWYSGQTCLGHNRTSGNLVQFARSMEAQEIMCSQGHCTQQCPAT